MLEITYIPPGAVAVDCDPYAAKAKLNKGRGSCPVCHSASTKGKAPDAAAIHTG